MLPSIQLFPIGLTELAMAGSPQLEDGYLRIANEIIEALASYRIPGEQMQCLFVILRKTYGYGKLEDNISVSQFHELTGLKKPSICRAICGLEEKNIISKNANKRIPSYQFNKKYKTWKVLAKKITVSNIAKGVSKSANESLAKKLPTKEKKDNIQYKEKIYKKESSGNGRFKKPSFDEVKEYCLERNNGIDPQYFIDSNEAKGWVVGKNRTPIKCWKSVIRTWEKNNEKHNKGHRKSGFKDARKSEETNWLS